MESHRDDYVSFAPVDVLLENREAERNLAVQGVSLQV